MADYLYGASVQGIQSFIFQTNKLREIAGASELVSCICSQLFVELLGKDLAGDNLEETMKNDPAFILHTAGNIRYIFRDEDLCRSVVREFPRAAMLAAPGITVCQAVVKIDGSFSEANELLEKKLKVQRNKPSRSTTLGLTAFRRSQHTGLPVTTMMNGDYIDSSTQQKLKAFDTWNLYRRATGTIPAKNEIVDVIDKIANHKNFIAVIHIDGNGLGSIVQRIVNNPDKFKQFSENLNVATQSAAQSAYNAIRAASHSEACLIRPIVLGGDDLTVLCNADYALDYAAEFIQAFERNTTGLIKAGEVYSEGAIQDRMTACAGIAYIKSSFPFYYGYDLAESLCAYAKKDAKNKDSIRQGKELPQSCIMFHKVQDTFAENYSDIINRELRPTADISLNFGPYYLNEKADKWTVQDLKAIVSDLNKKEYNNIKNTVRRWLSVLFSNQGSAEQVLLRAKLLLADRSKQELSLLEKATKCTEGASPAYDILSLLSL